VEGMRRTLFHQWAVCVGHGVAGRQRRGGMQGRHVNRRSRQSSVRQHTATNQT
jgi:hypothetical protein